MFKIKDFVVYPGHGVCVVKRIENKTIGGKSKDFYVLSSVDSQMTILTPIDDVSQIRPLLKKSELDGVLLILKMATHVEDTTWNKRYREYMELLKTGNPVDVALVVRNLTTLKNQKDLSFGERKMLDHGISLLATEIQYALGIAETKALEIVIKNIAA